MSKHAAHVYNSITELLDHAVGNKSDWSSENNYNKSRRHWIRVWNRHRARNGNTPLVLKCAICSGKERKRDIASGRWKVPKNMNELLNVIREGINSRFSD